MARWGAQTWQDVNSFDGCGFGKYCYILLGPTSLMPSNRSHNLLIRVRIPAGHQIQKSRRQKTESMVEVRPAQLCSGTERAFSIDDLTGVKNQFAFIRDELPRSGFNMVPQFNLGEALDYCSSVTSSLWKVIYQFHSQVCPLSGENA